MLVESHKKLEGNARFEGFTVDLAEELSRFLGFNYTIKLVDDGAYGKEVSPGNWNGMLGEVMILVKWLYLDLIVKFVQCQLHESPFSKVCK